MKDVLIRAFTCPDRQKKLGTFVEMMHACAAHHTTLYALAHGHFQFHLMLEMM